MQKHCAKNQLVGPLSELSPQALSKQKVDGKLAASEVLIQQLQAEIHEELSARGQAELRLAQAGRTAWYIVSES